MFRVRKGKLTLLTAAVGATLPSLGLAQVSNWTFNNNSAAWTSNWTTNSNWSPNTGFPNTSASNVTFGSLGLIGGSGTVNIPSSVSAGTVHFISNGAFGYTLVSTGGTLNLSATGGGTVDVSSGNTGTIDAPIASTASTPWYKTGTGTLILTGASTYSGGGITVNDGVLDIRNAAALNGINVISTAFTGAVLLDGINATGVAIGLGSAGPTGGAMLQAQGNNTYNGMLLGVAANASVGVNAASTLNVNGPIIDGTDPTVNGITKNGAGTLLVNNFALNGGLAVTGGVAKVKAGGTPNAAAGASTVNGLVIGAGATLDLTNNQLIDNYGTAASPSTTIRSYITSAIALNGSHIPTWTGTGLTSTLGTATGFALGYADGADNPTGHVNWNGSGSPTGASISAGQVMMRYTRYGDLNLDGVVNIFDLNVFAAHFGQAANLWQFGDLNYDGQVNIFDLNLFAGNFGQSAGFTGLQAVSASDQAALNAFMASVGVPEPTTLGLAALGGIGLLGRRKRRR